MFYTNPYEANIQNRDFWINTLNQMFIDSGNNLEKNVNKRTAATAQDTIKGTFTMPIIFDRSNSWQWGNSDFSLINLSGLHINSGNTTVIQAPAQAAVEETEEDRQRQKAQEKKPNYVGVAFAVTALLGALGFLGYCHSRFKKFEVSHAFFTDLHSKETSYLAKTRQRYTEFEKKLVSITSNYELVSKLQKDFYEGQVIAAFIDVIGLALLAGGYSFVAPQIITLGFFILAAGLGAGILSYGTHLSERIRIKHLYLTIFQETKKAITELKQLSEGQPLFPLATAVAIGQDSSELNAQAAPSAPPEDLTDTVLNYFDEDPTPLIRA